MIGSLNWCRSLVYLKFAQILLQSLVCFSRRIVLNSGDTISAKPFCRAKQRRSHGSSSVSCKKVAVVVCSNCIWFECFRLSSSCNCPMHNMPTFCLLWKLLSLLVFFVVWKFEPWAILKNLFIVTSSSPKLSFLPFQCTGKVFESALKTTVGKQCSLSFLRQTAVQDINDRSTSSTFLNCKADLETKHFTWEL